MKIRARRKSKHVILLPTFTMAAPEVRAIFKHEPPGIFPQYRPRNNVVFWSNHFAMNSAMNSVMNSAMNFTMNFTMNGKVQNFKTVNWTFPLQICQRASTSACFRLETLSQEISPKSKKTYRGEIVSNDAFRRWKRTKKSTEWLLIIMEEAVSWLCQALLSHSLPKYIYLKSKSN